MCTRPRAPSIDPGGGSSHLLTYAHWLSSLDAHTDDFRLFCGDLGNDVTDEVSTIPGSVKDDCVSPRLKLTSLSLSLSHPPQVLANAFRHKYPSFAKAKVRRNRGHMVMLRTRDPASTTRPPELPHRNNSSPFHPAPPPQVIRDKYKGKSKGFGFVSFLDPFEGLKGACI